MRGYKGVAQFKKSEKWDTLMLMIQRHRKQGQGFQQMREAPLKMTLSINPPPPNVTSTFFRVLSAVEKFSTNHPSRRNPPIAKLLIRAMPN